MFPKGVDPGSGRGSSEELQEVGLAEAGAGLGPEGSGFLGDTVELAAQAGDFIQGCGG